MPLFIYFACLTITGLNHVVVSSHPIDNGPVDKRILLQDNYYTIMSQLEALTKKVDSLTAQNHNLTLMYDQLKANAVSSGKEVAFYATLTTAVSGVGRYIHYDNVSLNIGNGYNPNHGVFVVPVSGTYLFSLYVCSGARSEAVLNVYVNTVIKGTMIADDYTFDTCNSKVFVWSVSAGDDVYVKTHQTRSANVIINKDYGLPSFTGVLLRAHT